MRFDFLGPCLALSFAVLSLLPASVAVAAPSSDPSGLRGFRAEDPRLEAIVDVRGHSITVGELLQELSRQSGIRIQAPADQSGAGDDRITFALPQVHLADAMEAVWGLLSYSDGEFQWRRTGTGDARVYQLERPLNARQLPGRLQALADAAFKQQLADLYHGACAAPPELNKLAHENDQIRLAATSPIIFPGIRLFHEVLTPVEQQRVIEGSGSFQRATRDLPDYGKRLVNHLFEASGRQGLFGGVVDPVEGPQWVKFYTKRGGGQLTSTLFIEVQGIGGHGYAGGTPVQTALLSAVYARWLQAGDTSTSDAERTTIPRLTEAASAGTPVARCFSDLAKSSSIPFIARLRPREAQDPGPSTGVSLAEFLKRLCSTRSDYHKKWRSGVLLLTTPDWYLERYQAAKVPWQTAQSIAETLKRSQGRPSLPELQGLAETLSLPQLDGIAAEVPLFEKICDWRDLLALRRTRPAVWSRLTMPRGLEVAAVGALGALGEKDEVKNSLVEPQTSGLRFAFKAESGLDGASYVILQAIDRQGQVLHGAGFGYKTEAPPWWMRVGVKAKE